MSRITKWNAEKTKVKVVFRLQFHATHIPYPGWDKLFVTFIPADSGKATAKTNKANVRNGNCKWSDPIYETTRLLLDVKTKKYDEKLYKLVAMGTSRSSLLGEATINLADYADASKPCSVALPLHGCNSGTVLHVTVQLLTSKTGFREFEQQRNLREKSFHTVNDHSVHAEPVGIEASAAGTDKANMRVRIASSSMGPSSFEEELNEDCTDSAVGVDDSSHTSESMYTEKHDLASTHEVDSLKSTSCGELGAHPLSHSPHLERGDQCDHRIMAQVSSDWVHGWSSDYSMDNDLAIAYEENSRLRGSLEMAESSISELKMEVSILQSHADELAVETQRLSQKFAAEITLGEQLSKEVSTLKSECSELKNNLEQLKHSKGSKDSTEIEVKLFANGMPWKELKDTEQHTSNIHRVDSPEPYSLSQVSTDASAFSGNLVSSNVDKHLAHGIRVDWSHALSLMEDQVREIQKKASSQSLGSLQGELEALELTLRFLIEENSLITLQNSKPSKRTNVSDIAVLNGEKLAWFAQRNQLEVCTMEQHHSGLDSLSRSNQSQSLDHREIQNNASLDALSIIKEKNCELLHELEQSKVEQENLMKKIDQMELYYESLIEELEESQKQVVDELQSLRSEHATCLYTISTYKNQIETMRQDIHEQLLQTADENQTLEAFNKELEKRALVSEAALKKLRWNYSDAVDQLQKDLELLSFQVLSMYETNESLARQAFAEASQVCFQDSPEKCKENKTLEAMRKEGNADNNALKVRNVVQTGLLDKSIQEKNLVFSASPPLSYPKNEISVSQSILKSKMHSLEYDACKSWLCQNQNADLNKLSVSEVCLLAEMKRALESREDLLCESESEVCEIYGLNLELEIFSKVLQEIIHDSSDDIRTMKKKMDELAQQVKHANESKEMLMLKLQTTLDDVEVMKETEAKCIIARNDLAVKNNTLEAKIQYLSDENHALIQKVTEIDYLLMECRNHESKYVACVSEKNDLENLLKQECLENNHLKNEISSVTEEINTLKREFDELCSMKADLEMSVSFLQDKLWDLRSSMISFNESIGHPTSADKPQQQEMDNQTFMTSILHLGELQKRLHGQVIQLIHEKKDVEEESAVLQESFASKDSEILFMKHKFESDLRDMGTKLELANAHMETLKVELQDISLKHKRSLDAGEKYAAENTELSSKLTSLENELQRVSIENKVLTQKIVDFDDVIKELDVTKITVDGCMQQNRDLTMALKVSNEETLQLTNELSILKENLRCSFEELQSERNCRVVLEGRVSNLTSQLNASCHQMSAFDEQKAELVYLRQQMEDLRLENSKAEVLLLQSKDCCRKEVEEASLLSLKVTDLETHLIAMHECLLAANIEAVFAKTQFRTRMLELLDQIKFLERCNNELQLKHIDALTTLKGQMASEAHYIEENSKLVAVLGSFQSELSTLANEKIELADHVDRQSALLAELENYKVMATTLEDDMNQQKQTHELEVEHLKAILVHLEEHIDSLQISRNESEIMITILKTKLDEQHAQIMLLKEQGHELIKLQDQHDQLSCKLSEQILKTEEFRNLSIHLKELKDKAKAEYSLARESEVQAAAMQESLRMAFIREQWQTQLQDLKSQLCISKKHGEGILLKLQDALDEIESRKKNEASHAKRNEELSLKILELETELQRVLSDKREFDKAYDAMKAELECSMMSLDFCKEKKLKLEGSLHECSNERDKIFIELNSVKKQLETLASGPCQYQPNAVGTVYIESHLANGVGDSGVEKTLTTETITPKKNDVELVANNDLNLEDRSKVLLNARRLNSSQVDGVMQDSVHEDEVSSQMIKSRSSMDILVPGSALIGNSSSVLAEDRMRNDVNLVAVMNEYFKEHGLKSSIERLNRELENMKNDNLSSLIQHNEQHPAFQGLQGELVQLQMANERLERVSSLFNEPSVSGNALERVLALEIELAEALQSKKKASINFQSSFLKKHNDEEAVFQSFRDINELIREMLEVKKRYLAAETELRDMHDRYSQLSLQFAEVEGERQQLLMTLKNTRLPKKS